MARALAYNRGNCDVIVAASSPDVYRCAHPHTHSEGPSTPTTATGKIPYHQHSHPSASSCVPLLLRPAPSVSRPPLAYTLTTATTPRQPHTITATHAPPLHTATCTTSTPPPTCIAHTPTSPLHRTHAMTHTRRLNLEQGRFLAPFRTESEANNCVAFSDVHHLLAFGGALLCHGILLCSPVPCRVV
jgi:hypothetical protein